MHPHVETPHGPGRRQPPRDNRPVGRSTVHESRCGHEMCFKTWGAARFPPLCPRLRLCCRVARQKNLSTGISWRRCISDRVRRRPRRAEAASSIWSTAVSSRPCENDDRGVSTTSASAAAACPMVLEAASGVCRLSVSAAGPTIAVFCAWGWHETTLTQKTTQKCAVPAACFLALCCVGLPGGVW